MLKLIPVSQLRLGMYIHGLATPWLEHPFWKKRFLLDKPADLRSIVANKIEAVWIDTAKGVDVIPAAAAQDSQPEEDTGAASPVPPRGVTRRRTPHPGADMRTSLAAPAQDSYVHACALRDQAYDTVMRLFMQAETDARIDVSQAQALASDIVQSVNDHPTALISVVRIRAANEYTCMHSVAVSALMAAFSRVLGHNAQMQHEAAQAGLLHDIGKAAIPPEILNKPDRLTEDEFTHIRTHPEKGHAILRQGGILSEAALDVCLHHHEKIDGTGYPHGLSAEQIGLYARMAALCDIYDAVTSDRPYKRGWNPAQAIHRMAQWHGHFDEALLRAFVRTIGVYPMGSLVRLASGRLGVVIEQHPHQLLLPRVRLLPESWREHTGPGRRRHRDRVPQMRVLDLSVMHGHDHIAGIGPEDIWLRRTQDAFWPYPVAQDRLSHPDDTPFDDDDDEPSDDLPS